MRRKASAAFFIQSLEKGTTTHSVAPLADLGIVFLPSPDVFQSIVSLDHIRVLLVIRLLSFRI